MQYQPKKILVTGGAGFIGAIFINFYQKKYPDIFIVNLDALTYASNTNHLKNLPHPENYIFIKGDINDRTLIENIMRVYKIDTVVHFAAESHVDNSINDPSIFVRTNVLGTHVLLDSTKKIWLDENRWDQSQCRFHHISTDEVYGSLEKNDPPFSEKNPYMPNSPYAASKAGADHLVRVYYHTFQLPVTISNCSNNYGPFQHAEKFIPTVIRSCLEKKPIPVYGDGSNIRDWLFVEDHCKAIDCILKNGCVGESYNIGGNHELDNITLAKNICRLMDEYNSQSFLHEGLIQFVTDRKGHDWRYAINHTKITQELGWKPACLFDDYLRKTIYFYLTEINTRECENAF